MFSPITNYKPFAQIDNNQNQTLTTLFTRNLNDMKYRASGSGRDSYVFDSNGGFTISNVV